jgi:glycosyltransferase involved in cell wall biosynthesis
MRPKVSVCIATYNGENYLEAQIRSILEQLAENDEVVVVDDCSTDNTVKILNELRDNRIKIYANESNRGHVFSFSRSISLANNDIIFLSDQDDIWISGRVGLMIDKLIGTNKLLATSNSDFINSAGEKINYSIDGVSERDSSKYIKNIFSIFRGDTTYFGCGMAFKKELVKVILPIPSHVESHDLWIAFAGNLLRSNLHLNEKTFLRRIHSNNASVVERDLFTKLWARALFIRHIIDLSVRIMRYSRSNNN